MPFVSSVRGNYAAGKRRAGDLASKLLISGGTITSAGGYRIHTFTTVGASTFNVSPFGLGLSSVEYLVIGGGAGATAMSHHGGGGGAGAYYSGSFTAPGIASYAVTVGAGGHGPGGISGPSGQTTPQPQVAAIRGSKGLSSIIQDVVTAPGGGVAGMHNAGTSTSGGSGGGGGGHSDNHYGTADNPAYGHRGGHGAPPSHRGGGGGGGAGGGGQDVGGMAGGAGGSGLSSSITGSAVTRAGGGGGSGYGSPGGNPGPGGGGGGRAHSNASHDTAFNGVANTGSGSGSTNGHPGGPGASQTDFGDGGSGVVIVRYLM